MPKPKKPKDILVRYDQKQKMFIALTAPEYGISLRNGILEVNPCCDRSWYGDTCCLNFACRILEAKIEEYQALLDFLEFLYGKINVLHSKYAKY